MGGGGGIRRLMGRGMLMLDGGLRGVLGCDGIGSLRARSRVSCIVGVLSGRDYK